MEALLTAGSRGAHRETLIRQAEISTASFYRALEPLLEAELVREHGGNFVLSLALDYNFAFKLWHDQDRLLQMDPSTRAQIGDLVNQLRDGFGDNILCLWLIGSAAHGTSTETSDFDLLAVVRKSRGYPVRAARAVQLTTLTRRQFRGLYLEGDGFVRSALQYGLILYDAGFAQVFYARTEPTPARRSLREREERLEKLRQHLLFLLRNDAIEEGRDVLSRLAVGTGRLMLERLGLLPAGKRDMLDCLQLYFGQCQAELFRLCLQRRAEASEMIELQRGLEGLYHRYLLHVPLMATLLQGLMGGATEFESACQTMLESMNLSVEGAPEQGDSGYSLLVKLGEGSLAIACKSMKGGLNRSHLRRPSNSSGPVMLVANLYRGVPLSKRPPIPGELESEAEQRDISLVDSRCLFQLHNRFWLEPSPPSPSAWLSRITERKVSKKKRWRRTRSA